jgi:hypothetical protein
MLGIWFNKRGGREAPRWRAEWELPLVCVSFIGLEVHETEVAHGEVVRSVYIWPHIGKVPSMTPSDGPPGTGPVILVRLMSRRTPAKAQKDRVSSGSTNCIEPVCLYSLSVENRVGQSLGVTSSTGSPIQVRHLFPSAARRSSLPISPSSFLSLYHLPFHQHKARGHSFFFFIAVIVPFPTKSSSGPSLCHR